MADNEIGDSHTDEELDADAEILGDENLEDASVEGEGSEEDMGSNVANLEAMLPIIHAAQAGNAASFQGLAAAELGLRINAAIDAAKIDVATSLGKEPEEVEDVSPESEEQGA